MATDTYLSSVPENTSILQATKFTFMIPDKPFLRYFCQTVLIPGVSTNAVEVPTPFSKTYRHGDRLEFEPLVITALIDEDMRVWEETYGWLRSFTKTKDLSEYARTPKHTPSKIYSDGYLTINTNANKTNMRFKFINVQPTGIGNINFDTKVDADVIPTADFSFRYDYYEIDRL